MRVLVVVLLLFGSGSVRADSRPGEDSKPTSSKASETAAQDYALIVDLANGKANNGALLELLASDLRLAGFELQRDEAARGVLLAPSPIPTSWAAERAILSQAQDAYEELDLDKSLRTLKALDEAWRSKNANAEGVELLAHRYFLGGLVRFAKGDSENAFGNFRMANKLAPKNASLSSTLYRPAVVKLFAKAVSANKKRDVPRAEGAKSTDFLETVAGKTTIKNHTPEPKKLVDLRAIRDAIAKAPTEANENLAVLATRTGVSVLVLLRNSPDGPQASVYRRGDGSLTRWTQVGSLEWKNALTPNAQPSSVVAAHQSRKASAPWYRTRWGGGLLAVGGGAVLGGALYFLLSSSDSKAEGATIDQWCFGSCN